MTGKNYEDIGMLLSDVELETSTFCGLMTLTFLMIIIALHHV